MNTFEERAAYIAKCHQEIEENVKRIEDSKQRYAHFELQMSLFWAKYNIEIATLIYRGMFDPTFCQPIKD
jgi:hypothetical protein